MINKILFARILSVYCNILVYRKSCIINRNHITLLNHKRIVQIYKKRNYEINDHKPDLNRIHFLRYVILMHYMHRLIDFPQQSGCQHMKL